MAAAFTFASNASMLRHVLACCPEQLIVYLPQNRRLSLARGEPLPKHTQGAAMFADISGFTPLAGLARVALASGDIAGASRHVESILSHLLTRTLEGTDEPLGV